MWLWGLVAGIILTALFLVITLAQVEAGAKGKSKWLALSFCSLAVVVGLIFVKPKVNLEQVNYQLTTPPAEVNPVQTSNPSSKQGALKSTSSAGALSAAGKAQTTTGKSQAQQVQDKGTQGKDQTGAAQKGATAQKQAEPTLQDQLNLSLQKKSSTEGTTEYSDPVLKEILDLKLQAEEKGGVTNPGEFEQFNDAGINSQLSKSNDSGNQEPASQLEAGSLDNQLKSQSEKQEQQIKQQQVVKAKVLVSSLNVREKGSMDSRIIWSLNNGDTVEVLNGSEANEWVNIKLNNEQTGWVMRNYLKIQS